MSKANPRTRVVFDCMIFLQATSNDSGPAAELLRLVDRNALSLFASREILDEVREVLSRPNVRKANPDITDENINDEVKKFMELNIIDSGDALTKGIGAIDAARVKMFYDKMVKAGLYKAGEVDLSKVATDQFVNKGVGLDVKKKLGK